MHPEAIEHGSIFWFDSGDDTLGQEECGRHPWVVVTHPRYHRRTKLVWAVPCTSKDNDMAFDIPFHPSVINAFKNVSKPLSQKKPCRVAKARKIRHFSAERIEGGSGQNHQRGHHA